MERQDAELTDDQFRVLDELCFQKSFSELKQQVSDINMMTNVLVELLENDLIQLYYPTRDEEINFDLKKFQDNYSDYYYLATKKGLKKLFG